MLRRTTWLIPVLVFNFYIHSKYYVGTGYLEYGEEYPEVLALGKPKLLYGDEVSTLNLHAMFRNHMLGCRNIRFLNNNDSTVTLNNTTINIDKNFYVQRMLDLSFYYEHQKHINLFLTLRNAYFPGLASNNTNNANVDFTYLTSSKLALYGWHTHVDLTPSIWIKEAWLEFGSRHRFKLGTIPFGLGRGISLGIIHDLNHYADIIFGSDHINYIDQFAHGFLLSGDFISNKLSYDLYLGFLAENSLIPQSFPVNTAVINQSRYHYVEPVFFAIHDKCLAARLLFKPDFKNNEINNGILEPYFLVDIPKKITTNYLDYISAHLLTVGMAGEIFLDKLDFGFDAALNFGSVKYGRQDNNMVVLNNLSGYCVAQNTDVLEVKDDGVFDALASCDNQKFIKSVPFSVLNNGKQILGTNLFNAKDRFNNEIISFTRGSMCHFDITYSFINRKLRLKGAVGYVSGSSEVSNYTYNIYQNAVPQRVNKEFDGFVPLQCLYNGKRVKSTYMLAMILGQIPRISSFPDPSLPNPYPVQIVGYTNLIHAGFGVDIKTPDVERSTAPQYLINPNIVAFWQDVAPRLPAAYGIGSGKSYASKYLGLEFNTYIRYTFLEGLEFFTVLSFFFPGQYYKDIKGLALNPDQAAYFATLANNKPNKQVIPPAIGTDKSWLFNCGIIYNF